ncbi:MAG: hypothetical protein IPL78_02315 [Chloroflexi bacterium]|nr:hypothetical protein [Chloroflexota bacterium]
MKKLIPLFLVFLFGLTVLALAAAPLPQGDAPSLSEPEREKIASKIDQVVLDQLLNTPDEPLTVIVHIGGSADLSGAAAFTDYADKGVYVYQTLQTFAEAKQAGIRAYLQQEQVRGRELTFRPFFIFNGLALTATPDLIWQIAARNDVQAITANNTYQLDRDWSQSQDVPHSPLSTPTLSISQSPHPPSPPNGTSPKSTPTTSGPPTASPARAF